MDPPCLLDALPMELLEHVALQDPAAHHGLALAYPRYGRWSLHATVQRVAKQALTRRDHNAAYRLPNGQLHRDDGPAWTVWRADGSKEREEWWRDGKCRRDD